MSDTLSLLVTDEPLNGASGDDTSTSTRRFVRYNFLAPLVFIAGVFYTIWATSSHLLSWPALVFAVVAAIFLTGIVLGIIRDGWLASLGAVVLTFFGLVLCYLVRHSVGHLLIPAGVEVLLLTLAWLSGIHVFRVRR